MSYVVSSSPRPTPRTPRSSAVFSAALLALWLSPTTAGGASPAGSELDREHLAGAAEALQRLGGTRSLLVAHRGEVVVEEHFRGPGRGEPVNIKSASKSLLSALVGIAIEEGHFQGVDQPLAEVLPGPFAGVAATKRQITLGHLLTMTAGLESTSGEHYGAWVSRRDWAAAALARPLLSPPGEEFRYSTGNSHLLSVALTEATGESTLAYARSRLLEPLGIRVSSWQRDPQGYYFGGNNLAMTPRDMLRFGQLYLDGGAAGGRQLVPSAWVEESARAHAEGWPERYGAYGYLWWVRPEGEAGAFTAVGYGGQYIYVAPGKEMVVVLTATTAGKGAEWDRRVLAIFRDQILAAAP